MTTWGDPPNKPPQPPRASASMWVIVFLLIGIGFLLGWVCV